MENKKNAHFLERPITDMTLKGRKLLGPRRRVAGWVIGHNGRETGNAQGREEMMSQDTLSLASQLLPQKLETVALLWEREEEMDSEVDGSKWEAALPCTFAS